MPYRTGSFSKVFFVVWDSGPSPRDLDTLAPLIEEMSRRVGNDMSYLTIVPPHLPVPTSEQRQALEGFARRVRPLVEHAYLVLQGDGFKASIQRSVVTGLNFIRERGFTTICKTVDEAVHKIAERRRGDYAQLAEGARAHQLMH